jgi:N-acetylmuramoyl-L-alanine amidase
MRSSVLRGFLPQILVSCFVPLTACGTVEPLASSVSSSPPVPVVNAKPVTTVVLDPGHNGANASHLAEINRPVPDGRGGTKACNTTGTSTDGGYPEHAFNWDVALRVRDALIAHGVRVMLTRPDDAGVGPCVNDRAAIANRAGADAMVSIHADGAAPSGHGFHIAYSDPPLNDSQGSPSVGLVKALAGALRASGFSVADYVGNDGLYPRSDLAGLSLARVPAALVECANMRNLGEAALVSTPQGRARYATAIAEGIVTWLASRR